MTSKEFTASIKKFALETVGFDLIGISRISLPEKHEKAVEEWVGNGFAGEMDYMVRSGEKRAHPEQTLPGAKSVLSLAINYYHPEDPKPVERAVGKVAKYAYGTDYHKVIEKKLKQLTKYIGEIVPGAQIKSYVDTGPILEKAFAQQSGLGFFGKNTNLITKEYGSWVFLASLITDLELEYDEPHTGSCGSCRICVDACPTGALLGNSTIDSRKCISYLTIESKEPHPEALKEGIGGWFFGCDICQEVCPYNYKPKVTRTKEWYPQKIAGTWVDFEKLMSLKTLEAFQETFRGSPLKRPKHEGLKRNAETVMSNLPPDLA